MIVNNTIAGNSATDKGGGIEAYQASPTIKNCIVWDNGDDLYGCSATYSCIQDGDPGTGNISADPLFADPGAGDYHLKSLAGRYDPGTGLPPSDPAAWVIDAVHSPCVDTADPASDYSLEPLPNGGRTNMGAYGGTEEASKSFPPHVESLELFYNGRFADAADPAKQFLAVGEASSMSLVGDDLHGNVTNYLDGITGIRVTFDTVVTFSVDAAAAFSYEATPEQSSDKTFTAFTPPTAPAYTVDNSTGKTVVTITFADGEIKNRWLKTIIDASQVVSPMGRNLDGELPNPLTLPSGDGGAGGNAEFIIGNRVGDVDGNYRCLLNDAVLARNHVSGATVVGIANAYDIDKNGRVLLNDAILTRNAVTSTALPALP